MKYRKVYTHRLWNSWLLGRKSRRRVDFKKSRYYRFTGHKFTQENPSCLHFICLILKNYAALIMLDRVRQSFKKVTWPYELIKTLNHLRRELAHCDAVTSGTLCGDLWIFQLRKIRGDTHARRKTAANADYQIVKVWKFKQIFVFL